MNEPFNLRLAANTTAQAHTLAMKVAPLGRRRANNCQRVFGGERAVQYVAQEIKLTLLH